MKNKKTIGILILVASAASIAYGIYTQKVTEKDIPYEKKSVMSSAEIGLGFFGILIGGLMIMPKSN